MKNDRNVFWVVEDNQLHAKMIRQAFGDDVDVVVFENGASLLERIAGRAAQCDVLILDWKLPDMSGLDVCRFLRKTHDEITLPVLLLTGQGNKADIVEGLGAGANDYLTKPFDATELRMRAFTLLRVKRLSEERARAEVERERYRELMLAMIGHDLRNPLNAITLGADALSLLDGTTDAHARVIARVKGAAGRMSRMIEQVLDFTRSRFGGIEINREPSDLSRIIEQCCEEFELAHPANELKTEIAAEQRGNWDSDRLCQVISNLLSNAANHGKRGAPIHLRTRQEKNAVVIEVRNEGEQIPLALQAEIFDPFRRGVQAGPRAKGMGLGLYIARQIVEEHGGEISVESSPEATSFFVRLPIGSP